MSESQIRRPGGRERVVPFDPRALPGHAAFPPERVSLTSIDRVPRWALLATIAFVTASVIVAVTAALTRGPWMDEFWSLWLTDTGIPWRAALWQRWLPDVHPPLFSAVSRLVSGAFGDELPLRRLQNLVPLAALVAFFVYVDRFWLRARRFVTVYAVLCFGSYFATGYFAEYRSYFAQFCLGIVFYACGYALLCRDQVAGPRERRVAIGLLAVSSPLLVNLHFVTAVGVAINLAVIGLVLLKQRNHRLFFGVVAIAALSTLPLAVTLIFQGPYLLAKSGGRFWIDTSWLEALQVIVGSMAKGIGVNVVACLAAAWGLWRVRRLWVATLAAARPPGIEGAYDRRLQEVTAGVAFLVASLATLAVLFVLNFQTPIIIDRYLVLCSVGITCAVAILAKDVVFGMPGAFALVLLNSALFLAVSADKIVHEPRWHASAALIATLPARCPNVPVEAFGYPYSNTLENEPAVLAFGYRLLSNQFEFPMHILTPAGGNGIRTVANCPVILWMENVPWPTLPPGDPDATVLAAAKSATGLADMTGADVRRTKTGAVIILNNSPRS